MPELPARAAEHLAARLAGLAAGRAAVSGGGAARTGAPPPPAPGDFPSLPGGAGSLSAGSLALPVSYGSSASARAPPMSTADKLAMKRAADARRLAPAAGPGPAEREREPAFRRVGGRWNSGALDLGTETKKKAVAAKSKSTAETDETETVSSEVSEAADFAARNDRLVAGVRASLDARGASFEVFANVSSRFKEGRLSGAAYLAKVTAMGLEAEHVKELASLMPDEALRLELRRAIAAGERARARKEGGEASVDAAAALLFGGNARGRAESSSASSSKTWDCPSCTFRNQAASAQCDMCDGARAGGGARGDGAGAPVSYTHLTLPTKA